MRTPALCLLLSLILSFTFNVFSATHPDDLAVVHAFRRGLSNSYLLGWPSDGNNDPCGPPRWPHIICSGDRVTSIHVVDMGVEGTLPPNFNMLTKLQNLALQRNNLRGALPTFRGLSKLRYARLDQNNFDGIPADFFHGLTRLEKFTLIQNPLPGWTIPESLKNLTNLAILKLSHCNLQGDLPDFLGQLPNLVVLDLSHNNLTGALPATLYQSKIEKLNLNDQLGNGLSGTIDVIASMVHLKIVWLHGNQFTWIIPTRIDAVTGLTELKLNRNRLTGAVPAALARLRELKLLDLSNNDLSPPLPSLGPGVKVNFRGNPKFAGYKRS